MAAQVQVPSLGESVTQAILIQWLKQDGETVELDEPICELETDKANVPLPAPAAGVLRHVKEEGATVSVEEVIARIDDATGVAPAPKAAVTKAARAEAAPAATVPAAEPKAVAQESRREGRQAARMEDFSPAVRRLLEENRLDPASVEATGPGGRLTKQDILKHLEAQQPDGQAADRAAAQGEAPEPAPPTVAPARQPTAAKVSASAPAPKPAAIDFDASGVRRVPMSRIRRRIAETLVHAQQAAAILTTFNEIDMSAVIALRGKYKEQFEKTHNVGLGFMSFFAKGVVMALKEFPRVNAFIDGEDIVYHNYVHLGIAVSTDRGLAVPVLRHVENMSFARIEAEIKRLALNVREGRLSIEELSGGTFTVTNGGVFGSLLSTPIINPPQSGILGMHAIQKRAVVVDDKIEIRPMMYVALSYDHRLVDGRESVSFLVRLKQLLEDPARLMLEV